MTPKTVDGPDESLETVGPDASLYSTSLCLASEVQLGAGTSGSTYLVANHLDGFRYCLKSVPLPDEASHVAAANEAAIHASTNHPGCVRYCFSWVDRATVESPRFCLLMELCDGDLWSALESGADSITNMDRLRWSEELASAVCHIHDRGVVHRDLNPWNVMTSSRGGVSSVKVGDFGLSARCAGTLRGMEVEGAAPLDESAIGSLYSAPELGEVYGLPADAFSLGMTVFAMWAGGRGDMDALTDQVEALRRGGGESLPKDFASDTHCPYAPLIQRLVAHEPGERPNAADAHDAIAGARTLSA